MKKIETVRVCLPGALLFCALSATGLAASSSTLVFEDPGFPAADTATPSAADLHGLFPEASFAGFEALGSALKAPTTALLVLPYGSAFPEAAWSDIQAYLSRGGNLLVLGGRPFTRAAWRGPSGWELRNYSVRFSRELRIDEYQETPGSKDLDFETNPDVLTRLPRFAWDRAFSPVIRLSATDFTRQPGSTGALDARLDALAWGSRGGRRLAAPAIRIDQLQDRYAGGRWMFLSAALPAGFYSRAEARRLVALLAETASRGSEEFTVRPALPLYLPGERIELQLSWKAARNPARPLTARITIAPENQPTQWFTKEVPLTEEATVTLAAPAGQGLYVLEARLLDGERLLATYRSGFWMRDQAYLRSGPKLGVNQDFFELDGRPLAVAGTTYMASDVQRLYFEYPNVYVWDHDLREIHDAGLNMLRTGWWWGWDRVADKQGAPSEHTLRTLEAYLMTARKYGLPVQFCLFGFQPEAWGGKNPYMDPESLAGQERLVSSLAARFGYVPFLAWDLINEPTISHSLWSPRPNGDPVELAQWNAWFRRQYPDQAALADAWNTVAIAPREKPAALPLEFYDFQMFVQQKFLDWANRMRAAIRATGSKQLVAVGQDEVGNPPRPCPAFFASAVDFTVNHSWWLNDSLLWDSLVTKQPGKAMLIQETGPQPEFNFNNTARRSTDSTGALVERKAALSFVQGSGVIEWLWYTNSFMNNINEATVGALRTDGTEKLEASVMRGIAAFAKNARDSLRNPERPAVAIVTSQAANFSSIAGMQIEAQCKAVRALAYVNRVPAYMIAENQAPNLGTPKLAILPSPQALGEAAWQILLRYVENGGNLLITGPVSRDPHWQPVDRLKALRVDGDCEPLTYKTAAIRAGDKMIPVSFDLEKQKTLEAIRFQDAAGLVERAHGKGRIFWAAYPVELADGAEPASALYSYVLERVGVEPLFQLESRVPEGVLIFPTVLQDAVMYVMESEDASDAEIRLTDETTKARLELRLPSERAALAILRKSDGKVIAKYGF
jgi:hypothetical protein